MMKLIHISSFVDSPPYKIKTDIYFVKLLGKIEEYIIPWVVGDCCVSLKMLKSPHKQIYSFKLAILWLSLSSSLPLPKYFNQYAHHTTTEAY